MNHFSELRALLTDPSPRHWLQLIDLFDKWEHTPERELALQYAEQHLNAWPFRLRRYPFIPIDEILDKSAQWAPFRLALRLELSRTYPNLDQLTKLFNSPISERLRILDLSTNRLQHLPNNLSKLTQLRILHVDHNELTQFPTSCGELKKLEELKLSHNKLTSLPESICTLEHLKTLSLSVNELIHISENISECKQLEELYLRNNRLTNISSKLAQLPRLQVLTLSNNQLPGENINLFGQQEIRSYFLQLRHVTRASR
ncbi:MAG: hypothetical protein CL920_30300 [Deltaproteobacteria bacterium]|nr:hypothetical protein [Deltaproteobacteria bacterium]MBU53005.1 hypothetical protein [Deltaproteobacteria bacterium]|tara:strand:- start:6963 stop:7736 length:774 start_codon:yes stop_codon:yes gene_type:complete